MLNVKDFLSLTVEEEATPSQKVVGILHRIRTGGSGVLCVAISDHGSAAFPKSEY